jgi:hypothetical protein
MENCFKKSGREILALRELERFLTFKMKGDVVNKNNTKPQFNAPCSKLLYKRLCCGAHTATMKMKLVHFFILELNYGAPQSRWCSCVRHDPFCEDDL